MKHKIFSQNAFLHACMYTLAFDKAKKLQTLPFKKHLHWVPLHTSSNIVSKVESTADSALSRETTPHRQGVTIQHAIGKSINLWKDSFKETHFKIFIVVIHFYLCLSRHSALSQFLEYKEKNQDIKDISYCEESVSER